MTRDDIKRIIEHYRPNYDHFKSVGNVNISIGGLNELNDLHVHLFQHPAKLDCGNCVIEMLMNIYKSPQADPNF